MQKSGLPVTNDSRPSFRPTFLKCILLLVAGCLGLPAEDAVLVVNVKNPQGRPIAGVQLSTEGDGSIGPPTDRAGKTRIRLAPQTRVKSSVSLLIVEPNNLVFISPWDNRAQVPSYENETENFVPVVLAKRNDRALLENGTALIAIAAQINKASAPAAATPSAVTVAPVPTNRGNSKEQQKEALAQVAKNFGLPPEDVKKAISGLQTDDPFGKAQIALFKGNYAEAESGFSSSLEARKQELEQDKARMVDAAFFLGDSLLWQAKYTEAVKAFQQALAVIPDHSPSLKGLGMALTQVGDYVNAEPLTRKVLEYDQKTFGPNHILVAGDLMSLAGVLEPKGMKKTSVEAEDLLNRSLMICERLPDRNDPNILRIKFLDLISLGRHYENSGDLSRAEQSYRRIIDMPETASSKVAEDYLVGLLDLANVLQKTTQTAEAESLLRKALEIVQQQAPTGSSLHGTILTGLGTILFKRWSLTEAESCWRQSLSIYEKQYGPDHLFVDTTVQSLGVVVWLEGDYNQAESLLRKALAMQQKRLGPDDPDVATTTRLLGTALERKGDVLSAEKFYRRALDIQERKLGPEHPDLMDTLVALAVIRRKGGDIETAEQLGNRALAIANKTRSTDELTFAYVQMEQGETLRVKGEYNRAAPLLRNALTIREKHYGPSIPPVASPLLYLAKLLGSENDYTGAEPLARRAIDIREKILGKDHPDVASGLAAYAVLQSRKGDCAAAKPFYERALAIRQKAFGANDPRTEYIRHNLDQLTKALTTSTCVRSAPFE